jgi:hypothetical protein
MGRPCRALGFVISLSIIAWAGCESSGQGLMAKGGGGGRRPSAFKEKESLFPYPQIAMTGTCRGPSR